MFILARFAHLSPTCVEMISPLNIFLPRHRACSSGLKTAGGVLFLVSVTCFLALLSVNSDMIIFHYLFAGFNCVQVSLLRFPMKTQCERQIFVSSVTSSPLMSSKLGSLHLLLPHRLQQGGEECHEILLQPKASRSYDQI